MADKYPDFETLAHSETPGVDFRILVRRARSIALLAPHGGGIEPGTSELADAIAGDRLSFYAFEGMKPQGNGDLHITSTHFDEPMCLTVVPQSGVVLALHGEGTSTDDDVVFLGGLDDALGCRVRVALQAQGFDVRHHTDPRLQGREANNICNRGRTGRGVQLELPQSTRRAMFRSLSRDGRKETTQRFRDFVAALRVVLGVE